MLKLRSLKYLIAILLVVLLGSALNKPSLLQVDIILSNASIIDIRTGKLISNKFLVINGRLITAIPDAGSLQNYKARQTIDAQGKFIIPGLWDMHVHFRGGDSLINENKALLPLFIVNGITTVREAGGDISPSVFSWRKAVNDGTLTGPRIFTSGPKLDGPKPAWAGSLKVQSLQDVENALDSLQKVKADFVKTYDGSLSESAYLLILSEAYKRGMSVSGHMPFSVMLRDAIANHVGSIEHLYYVFKGCSDKEAVITARLKETEATSNPLGFWGALPLLYDSYNESLAADLFRLMAARGTVVVPTLCVTSIVEGLSYTDHSNDEWLKYIGTGIQKTYEGRLKGAKNANPEFKAFSKKLQARFKEMVPKMQKAGITLLAGSDSGPFNSFVYPGISLHRELELMVESGLSPAQALQTATINSARFMKKEKESGSIDTGKMADLLILDRNPLENISNTQSIFMVIQAGRVYNRKALDGLLVEVRNKE